MMEGAASDGFTLGQRVAFKPRNEKKAPLAGEALAKPAEAGWRRTRMSA
jgi:hypothetical protein